MLYAPVALMHGSLAARFLGDLFTEPGLRQWGALLNAVALVVFLVFMVRLAQRARPLA